MSRETRSDRRVEERLDALRGALRDRHAGVEPDAGFASRVVARLAPSVAPPPVEVAGRLAWRLLPVTVAIAGVLVWAALTIAPTTELATGTEVVAPSDDPLSWVLDLDEATS